MPPPPVLTSLLPRDEYRPPAQFVRVHIYAIQGVASRAKSGAVQQGKPAIADILNEALRASATGYRHLIAQGLRPQQPRILHGPQPQELWAWYEAHKQRAARNTVPYVVKKTGRVTQRRQDVRVPTVLAEVMSYPGPPDDRDAKYVEWRALCVARLRRIYGDMLVSVIEHTDEAHGHLHALVAHPDGSPVRALHPGHSAADRSKAEGGAPKEQQASYRAGLKEFQSDFYSLVGFPAGLARLSAKPKARVSYQQAQANRQAEREYADRVAALLKREKQFEEEQAQFTAMLLARAQEIEAEGQNMMQRAFQRAAEKVEAQNAKRAAELNAEAERLASWQARLDETEALHRREKDGFAALTEHVRVRLRDADRRYALLLEAISVAVDLQTYQHILGAAEGVSASLKSSVLGKL
ncbi:hypothetical protein SAMN04489711_11930 [Paracidovorax wautersii]|uniref:Plasmid recombination enzyme n=1 Tax=Paracidovorax wautersii TaxID=1177982 RepID=A0A1I2H6F8_9BURK|nr:hypothetical protein SAMN04489711_11930 [Paracidovorax wautersii]